MDPGEPAPRTVVANGVRFAYVEAGPADGPLALCLHGFPDTAHTWRHLLPELAAAGYHAVAPWLRGYAPSAIPADGCYQSGALATDAGALHDALGAGPDAVIVGHDWGAFAAYGAAGLEPERWRRVVTLAVPPLAALGAGFFSYDQLKRSFYVFVFQTPMAEAAVCADNYAFVDRLWADWSPGYGAARDLSWVKESIGAPENLAAAIGYYRTMLSSERHDPRYAKAQEATTAIPPQPTLYLHGRDDGCMGLDAVGDVEGVLSPGSRYVVVDGAGHFLQLDQPALVNAEVLAFLAG